MPKCSGACKLVVVKGVKYCCCSQSGSCLPRWLKIFLLAVSISVPVILAAKWVVVKGHLEYVINRMHFLAKERRTLECDLQTLMERCSPSHKVLSGSAARRKAALDQLRNWAWQSDCTSEKSASRPSEEIPRSQNPLTDLANLKYLALLMQSHIPRVPKTYLFTLCSRWLVYANRNKNWNVS